MTHGSKIEWSNDEDSEDECDPPLQRREMVQVNIHTGFAWIAHGPPMAPLGELCNVVDALGKWYVWTAASPRLPIASVYILSASPESNVSHSWSRTRVHPAREHI